MRPTKNENGELYEIVNWSERNSEWGWAAIYDRPWIALEGCSIYAPKELQRKWEENKSKRNRIVDQWKDGDIIIYNPDWTVKEWIKGDLHKENIEQEVENEQ